MTLIVMVYVYRGTCICVCVNTGLIAPCCFVLVIAFMRPTQSSRPPGHQSWMKRIAAVSPSEPLARPSHYGDGKPSSTPGSHYGEPHVDTHSELSVSSSPQVKNTQ
jgi:hypothetical protein